LAGWCVHIEQQHDDFEASVNQVNCGGVRALAAVVVAMVMMVMMMMMMNMVIMDGGDDACALKGRLNKARSDRLACARKRQSSNYLWRRTG